MTWYAGQDNQLKPTGGNSGVSPFCVPTLVGFSFGACKMKKIELTRGEFAVVDDADFEWLNQWKWYAQRLTYGGYAAARATKKPQRVIVYMHRVIMNPPKCMDIDHQNHNTLDNQRHNLRVCTRSQNLRNRRPYGETSRYKGVSWHRPAKKWVSSIRLDGKQQYLGVYCKEIEAAKAYRKAAKKHLGEFAYTALTR